MPQMQLKAAEAQGGGGGGGDKCEKTPHRGGRLFRSFDAFPLAFLLDFLEFNHAIILGGVASVAAAQRCVKGT